MDTSFKQLCLGWTLAFVLVVGSIIILALTLSPCPPCGPEIREDPLGQVPDACCEAREEGAR